MTRYAFVIDLDRCIGCQTCEVACKYENNVALGEYWNKVIPMGPFGEFPKVQMYWLPAMCQQCKDAPCVKVCPTGASYRNEDGIVLVNKEVCIGCKYCMMACPYGVRSWNKKEGCVEKCTMCTELETPPCVSNCPGGCRYVGDLDDPSSEAAKALAAAKPESIHELPDFGNGPSAKYILSAQTAPWQKEW